MDVCFIINPIAGPNTRKFNDEVIHKYLGNKTSKLEVYRSSAPGHIAELTGKAVENNFDVVAICGGDGSINEAGKMLLHTSTKLALIPIGSGNGLAHHLKIPISVHKTLDLVLNGKTVEIDAGRIQNNELGEQFFFSNFGIGFDAEVIHNYSSKKGRGFGTYIFCMFQSIFSLEPKELDIQLNGKRMNLKPFVFTVANSSQYGYKIKVAPHALISDGILDTLLVRDASFFRVLKFAIVSAMNKADKIGDVAEFETAKSLTITPAEEIKLQIDGEPYTASSSLQIDVLKQALKVLIPKDAS